MKITVADIGGDELFNAGDFVRFVQREDLALLSLQQSELLDGSVFRALPSDTTHLVTRITDQLGPSELLHLPQLRYVGLAYAGWWDKYFDSSALRARNVTVTNNPHYAPRAVAECVFACILTEFRKLDQLRLGDAHQKVPSGRELHGRTFGILGMGNIGRTVAQIAQGLGMRVQTLPHRSTEGVNSRLRAEFFKNCDVLGIFVPKSAGTILRAADFASLKNDIYLVNPSGHELIDSDALQEFLASNPASTYAYLAMPELEYFQRFAAIANAKLFPLFAGNTLEARQRRKDITLANLQEYLAGGPLKNRVI